MILGIDPGFTGALCVIGSDGTVNILDMPLTIAKIITSRDKNREIDAKRICQWLDQFPIPALAVIEGVSSMPGNGVASMFRFGEGYGLLQGILAARGIERVIRPRPGVWKPSMGLSANKSDSLTMARKLTHSKHHHYFNLKKNDGRAEALLLAIFGAKSLGWNLRGLTGETINDIF